MRDFTRGGTTTSIGNSVELENILKQDFGKKSVVRTAQLLGMWTKDKQIKANIPSKDRSAFSQVKYQFFLDAPFEISHKCCNVMKKEPSHRYSKETGKVPILATMASESRLRTQKWLQNGCNGFDMKLPTSTPMSFWTEQDVLLYIKLYGERMIEYRKNYYREQGFTEEEINEIKELQSPICSVYGDVVEDYDKTGQLEGQVSLNDLSAEYGIFDGNPPLRTTGCERTGCVLCGFGAHCKGDTRFVDLKQTHPKLYGLMDVVQNNGVTMRQAIDWINEHGNLNIRY